MSDKKEIKHPSLYTTFVNNHLINADKSELANLSDNHFYHEILNINHRENPLQLTYVISDEYIFPNDPTHAARNKELLKQRLQTAKFYFEKKFMRKYFNEDADSSMVPFPEINIGEGFMVVRLYDRFKWILMMLQKEFAGESIEDNPIDPSMLQAPKNFTKGDIDTLRGLKNTISGPFYWLIRKKQPWQKVWKTTPDELKFELKIMTKHKRWEDLKNRVIEIAKEDFLNTWVEFEYDYFPKEKGKKVKELIFTFKKGPDDEKDLPIGQEKWENTLLQAGFEPHYIKEIRQRIKTRSVSPHGFGWSVDYVELSLKAAREEFVKKSKRPSKVKEVPNWLYNGLMTGQWIAEVVEERNKILKATQPEIPFDHHEVVTDDVDTEQGAKKVVDELFVKYEDPKDDPTYIAQYARKMRQLNQK
jgi:plasmid replication initiation protein